MADINRTEAGLPIAVTDGTSDEVASVTTSTPSSSNPALNVREVERGQNTAANSIPVVLASDQSSLPVTYDYAEDSAHVSGDVGVFVMGVRNDNFGTTFSGTNGDYTPIAVDGTGKVFGASDRVEDAAHASGHVGSFVLGVRNDAAATRTSADGDYSPISVDSAGRLLVTTGTGTNMQVVGNVAHDAVDSGNPVKVGGRAHQTNRTAVADADRTDLMTDDVGRLVTVSSHVRDLVVSQTTAISSASETTILTAGGAGVFHDITHITLSSTQANSTIEIRDATGGTVIWQGRIDNENPTVLNFNPPLPQTTANNNWTADRDSGSGDLYVTVVAVKNV